MVIFTKHTQIQVLMEKDAMIENNAFDFYGLAELKTLANDNQYLTDVIGVVKLEEPLRKFTNKLGVPQTQYKLQISDGRTMVKVTLWDSLALLFDNSMGKDCEMPIILIIASAKVGLWQDEVDISNLPATMIYINYAHYSVYEMRKMLKQPEYSHLNFFSPQSRNPKLYSSSGIKNFGKEFMDREVICQVKIKLVDTYQNWFIFVCTSCNKDVEKKNVTYHCVRCNRYVTYPLPRYELATLCSDNDGDIDIMMSDRQVRTIVGMNVHELEIEMEPEPFPSKLKKLEGLDCTIKLLIKEGNVNNVLKFYWATDLFVGFDLQDKEQEEEDEKSLQPTITGDISEVCGGWF